jgi:hypothetical protein
MIAYWERDSEWMGEGLVGAWCPSFTGATGLQLADISGNGNHAIGSGTDVNTTWVQNGGQTAIDLDGVNDYFNTNSNLECNGAKYRTISCWLQRTSTSTSQFIGCWLGPNGGTNRFGLYLLSSTLYFVAEDNLSSGYASLSGMNLQEWTHLVLQYNGAESGNTDRLTGYVNGEKRTLIGYTGAIPTSLGTNLGNFLIGYNVNATQPYGTGRVDDVRLYGKSSTSGFSSPLSPTQIQQLYTGGRGAGMLREPPRRRSFQGVTIPRPSSNPVRRKPRKNNTLLNGLVGAWCPSLGANGTRLLDVSGRNNHGVLTNMDANSDYIPSGGKLALDCDGTDDICVMRLSKSLELTAQPVSYSFWHTGTVSGAGATLAALSSQSNTSAWLQVGRSGTNNLLIFNRSDTGGDASVAGGTWSTSNWRHLVAVRDRAGYMSLWQNGVRVLNLNSIGGGATTVNCFAVAGLFRGASGAQAFTGTQWDDARVYERALTGREINQLYQGGRGYGLKQQRIKVGYTDPSPNLNKISIRKPKKKNTLTTGLVGAWCPSLGPTGTRLRDVSGRNNDGVLTNMDPNTDWVTSGGKGALDFDGVNDTVLIPENNALPIGASSRTYSAWVYADSFSNYMPIFSMGTLSARNSIAFLIAGAGGYVTGMVNGNVVLEINTDNVFSNGVIPLNKWTHVAVAYSDNQQIKTSIITIDGKLQTTQLNNNGSTSVLNTTKTTPSLGDYNGIWYGKSFLLDDVRIYNRALTPSEIQQLYTGGRGVGLAPAKRTTSKKTIYVDAPVPAKPKPAVDTSKLKQGLVGAWIPSLGPTGLRLEDRSPYKNHGTLTNMDPATCWKQSGGADALNFSGGIDDRVVSTIDSNYFKTYTNPFTFSCFAYIRSWRGAGGFESATFVSIGTVDYQAISFQAWKKKLTIYADTNGTINWEFGDTPPIGSWDLSLGTWLHLSGTRSPSGIYTVFVNGIANGSVTNTSNLIINNNTLKFGGHYGGNTTYDFDGLIDDVRIYNRALTAQEIQALYLGGRGYGFRPQRERYVLGTETINTGGFKGAWYRRRPLMLGSGIQ